MIKSRLNVMLAINDMTLGQLQEATGIRSPTLSQIKAGTFRTISQDNLCRLCEALHCQPGDLFVYIPDSEGRN